MPGWRSEAVQLQPGRLSAGQSAAGRRGPCRGSWRERRHGGCERRAPRAAAAGAGPGRAGAGPGAAAARRRRARQRRAPLAGSASARGRAGPGGRPAAAAAVPGCPRPPARRARAPLPAALRSGLRRGRAGPAPLPGRGSPGLPALPSRARALRHLRPPGRACRGRILLGTPASPGPHSPRRLSRCCRGRDPGPRLPL
nr:uncharacterized protein LOC106629505 [Zonotrichia albicollis]